MIAFSPDHITITSSPDSPSIHLDWPLLAALVRARGSLRKTVAVRRTSCPDEVLVGDRAVDEARARGWPEDEFEFAEAVLPPSLELLEHRHLVSMHPAGLILQCLARIDPAGEESLENLGTLELRGTWAELANWAKAWQLAARTQGREPVEWLRESLGGEP